MKLDAALICRYDRHGPRYTSYPMAVQFHSGFDAQSYRRVALLSNCGITRPLSIYVHVPFCAQPSCRAHCSTGAEACASCTSAAARRPI